MCLCYLVLVSALPGAEVSVTAAVMIWLRALAWAGAEQWGLGVPGGCQLLTWNNDIMIIMIVSLLFPFPSPQSSQFTTDCLIIAIKLSQVSTDTLSISSIRKLFILWSLPACHPRTLSSLHQGVATLCTFLLRWHSINSELRLRPVRLLGVSQTFRVTWLKTTHQRIEMSD